MPFNCLSDMELDEEPAEVEVKPILRSLQQVNISVVVEPPSSEDSSQARPAKEEADENAEPAQPTRTVTAEQVREEEDEAEEETALETAAIARLGERIVEGAEEPVVERTNSAAAARGTGAISISFIFSNQKFPSFVTHNVTKTRNTQQISDEIWEFDFRYCSKIPYRSQTSPYR